MRKIAFLLGLVVMTTSLAFAQSNYELQEDGTYKYVGAPVSELNVDFTTWNLTDLPALLTDDNTLSESHNLGFVKWKMATRNCGEKGEVNALFNNSNGDFEDTSDATKNDANPIKPRIFLPTTSTGVSIIRLYGGNGDVSLNVYFKDDNHANWTFGGELKLSMMYDAQSMLLQSKGQTSIYIEYAQRPYIALTDLVLEIGSSSDPNIPSGELDWDQDGTYWGDSVDYVYENFNEWPMHALRAEFTSEDLQQYKKLGFIRWRMEKRANLVGPQLWDGTDKRTCIFTNNPEINGFFTTDSAHHAKIYLPTLKYGAGAIRIEGYASTTGGNAISMQLGWYNEEWSEDQSGYTFIKSIAIPGDGSNIAESGLDIEEPVTIEISYQQSPYPSLYSIQVSPYGYPLSDDPETDFANLNESLNPVYGGTKAVKMLVNGQVIVIRAGKTYNMLGTPIDVK